MTTVSERAKNALHRYFEYKRSRIYSSGRSETIIGKLASGDYTYQDNKRTSIVPVGVEFTDLEFLNFIRRMDGALHHIKETDERCFYFAVARYDNTGLKVKDIAKKMNCSERTCRRLNNKALNIVNKHLYPKRG